MNLSQSPTVVCIRSLCVQHWIHISSSIEAAGWIFKWQIKEKKRRVIYRLAGEKKTSVLCYIFGDANASFKTFCTKWKIQNENKEEERVREKSERRAGSHMIKKGAEVDEERKRHCIEYWIYILYVTDEDQWNQNQQRTRNIIICKFGFLLFLIKTSERRLFCLSSFDSFVFCDFHFFFAFFAVSFDIQMMYKTQYKQLRSGEGERRGIKDW